MKIIQSMAFENKVAKLSKIEKSILDLEIRKILEHSSIGQEMRGDLRGVFIHTFRITKIQHIIAYQLTSNTLELIVIGPTSNYYKLLM